MGILAVFYSILGNNIVLIKLKSMEDSGNIRTSKRKEHGHSYGKINRKRNTTY